MKENIIKLDNKSLKMNGKTDISSEEMSIFLL